METLYHKLQRVDPDYYDRERVAGIENRLERIRRLKRERGKLDGCGDPRRL